MGSCDRVDPQTNWVIHLHSRIRNLVYFAVGAAVDLFLSNFIEPLNGRFTRLFTLVSMARGRQYGARIQAGALPRRAPTSVPLPLALEWPLCVAARLIAQSEPRCLIERAPANLLNLLKSVLLEY